MPRIPEELIERLKREVALVAVVQASGVEIVRQGKEWVGACPLHEESEPSLFVNPDKGSWHCFGCGRGGSVIDWRMQTAKLSFREAVESLVAEHHAGDTAEPPAPSVPPLPLPEVDALLAASDAEVGEWIVGHYHGAARTQAKPKEYLASRGLEHPQLVERFRIGFADRTLGLRLPDRNTRRGESLRAKLQRLGFLRESGHEHQNGRVVVPFWSLEGELAQMYGRAVTPNLRTGTPDHLYLARPLDGIVNPEAFEGEELILCEAPIDALTFWCAGFRNVTTTCGAHSFPPALFEAMRRGRTKRVLVAFDRDDAGDQGAKSIAERLAVQGVGCYRVLFPKGMDVNLYAQKVHPAANSLDLVLRNAQWMGEGKSPAVLVPEISEDEARAAETETAAKEEAAASVGEESTGLARGDAPDPLERAAVFPLAADSRLPAPPGSLLPSSPAGDVGAEVKPHEVVLSSGDRRYRVRGLERNLSYDVLKVNLLAARGDGFHVDTFDLYAARARAHFVEQAAIELGCDPRAIQRDLGQVLAKLEELQEHAIKKTLEPAAPVVEMSAEERAEAIAFLEAPDLPDRILADFERSGLVGESTNKLVAYFAAVSRKLTRPLAVLVQSSSAAGKSALMEAVLAFVPEEERVSYSAMTGQSLFYMGEKDLKHKVLAIAEEEGAERASYALKLLQSEGKLSIASTGKDPHTGKLVTHEYHVEGPVAILFTTTAIDLDEELLNRCLVLTVDEGREQTRAIHRVQRERETLEGQLAVERRERLRKLHQNAQRLLEPVRVVNPFAEDLSFPDSCTRTRRDHEKYLSLIRAIALVHQRQRPRKSQLEGGRELPYVEVTLDDLALANRLAHEVLGRTLDELPPQTRRLLHLAETLVTQECEELGVERREFAFTRRWLREKSGWGDTQLKVHLSRLVELEYLVCRPTSHAQRHLYELLYDGAGKDGKPFLPGLIDLAALGYDGNRSASEPDRSGLIEDRSAPGRPPVGGWSGGGRSDSEPSGASLRATLSPIPARERISAFAETALVALEDAS